MQTSHDEITLVKEQTIISNWLRLSERLILALFFIKILIEALIRFNFLENILFLALIGEIGSFISAVMFVLILVYIWFYRKITAVE